MTYWYVGMRVRNLPENAHLQEGTPWAEKLALPRLGTVKELPWYIRKHGHGTLLIEWDSLTGQKNDPAAWRMWIHSNSVRPA